MKKKQSIVIACEVFRPELEYLIQNMTTAPVMVFLEQGLHDTPSELKRLIQEAIDEVERTYAPTKILMGYGFCGRGLHGISGKKACLIIPKVHDCIPVLLGTNSEKEVCDAEYKHTYWTSAGWLAHSHIPFIQKWQERYDDYLTRFDADAADYLMEMEASWLTNYTSTCLITWDGLTNDAMRNDAHRLADNAKLAYRECVGNTKYVQALLDGGKDLEYFFHIAPGMSLDIDEHGALALVPVSLDM